MLKVVRDYTGARRDDRRALHVAEASATVIEPDDEPTDGRTGPPTSQRRAPDPDIVVSQAGFRDMVRARRVEVVHHLNQPEFALMRSGTLPSPTKMVGRRCDLRPVVLVGSRKQGIAGFADFRPVLPDVRWQLVSIGAGSDAGDPRSVWIAILDEGTRLAGAAGVKRLYARAPDETPVGEALRNAGYSPYASEMVFVADAPEAITDGIDVRDQERADTWAVHQLYNSSVPREVLYAEAYTSHRWELPGGRLTSGRETRAWIYERNHTPIAYARCATMRRRHMLDVIFAPGHLDEMAQVLDELILRLQRGRAVTEIYCAVRSYNMELERVLVERKFRPWLQQELLVRYTTAPIRVMTAETILSESEVVERAKQRVPVYFSSAEGIAVPGQTGPEPAQRPSNIRKFSKPATFKLE